MFAADETKEKLLDPSRTLGIPSDFLQRRDVSSLDSAAAAAADAIGRVLNYVCHAARRIPEVSAADPPSPSGKCAIERSTFTWS